MSEPERNRHIQFLRSLPRPLRDKNGRAVPYPGTWMKFPGEELPRRLYTIEERKSDKQNTCLYPPLPEV